MKDIHNFDRVFEHLQIEANGNKQKQLALGCSILSTEFNRERKRGFVGKI